MANKKLYLSNSSSRYGPSELAGLGGARALVLGRQLDLLAISNLREYFSVIISEDANFSVKLFLPPDIEFWQQGSPYVSSRFSYPIEQDVLYMTNYKTLKAFEGLQYTSGTYNLAYLPGGNMGIYPSVIRGISIGLDELALGIHLAKIMGVTDIWDSEGRSGTTPATVESIQSLINSRNQYGISSGLLGQRFSLLEQI